jgi:glutaryl-CoA dehydrogenase (non-decarboxylating)
MYSLDQGRFTVAAGACGVIRVPRALGRVRARAPHVRQPIGVPVRAGHDRQMVSITRLEAARDAGAWLKNEASGTRADVTREVARDRVGVQAAHNAIQIHGSYGYSAEYGIERYFRNARAPIIYEGTTQIHKMMQRSMRSVSETERREGRSRRSRLGVPRCSRVSPAPVAT